jgi:hypothetical protein
MATKKKNTTKTSFSDYKVDRDMSITRRVADFLNWYAEKCPKRVVDLPDLIKTVRMERRRLHPDSQEVTRFKGRLWRAGEIMYADYGREIVTIPGIGVRATTDDEDIARMKLSKRARTSQRAAEKAVMTADLIDERNITDRKLRTWVRSIKGTVKQINALGTKLLPMPEKDSGENK